MELPDVQRSFHLSDTRLGVVLAVTVGAAGFAGAVVGRLARYVGARRLLAAIVVVWSVSAILPGSAYSTVMFAVGFGVAQVAAGCVDAAMNAPATVHFLSRPSYLVRYHALFNVGALLGACVASVALSHGVSWRWLWPMLAIMTGALGVVGLLGDAGTILDADVRPHAPTVAAIGETATAPVMIDRSLRRDGLLGFLIVFGFAEITEGGAFTWGVLFLRHHLRAGILVGAGAYIIGHSIAATSRYFGATALRRVSVTGALVVGSLLCALGLAGEAATNVTFIAACGLALATAGTSLFWPLVMSTIAQRSRHPGRAVGSFTAAGYVGWVAGAPIVGSISDAAGAKWGLLTMSAIALGVVVSVMLGIVPPEPDRTLEHR